MAALAQTTRPPPYIRLLKRAGFPYHGRHKNDTSSYGNTEQRTDHSNSHWTSAIPISILDWVSFFTSGHQVEMLSLTVAIVATIAIGIVTMIEHRGKIDPFPPTISMACTQSSHVQVTLPPASTVTHKRDGSYRLRFRKLGSLRKSVYIRRSMIARFQKLSDDLTTVYSGLRHLQPHVNIRWLVYRNSILEAQVDLLIKLEDLQQQLEDLSDAYTLCKGQLRRQYSLTIKDTIKLEKKLSKLEQKFHKDPNAQAWKNLPLSAFRKRVPFDNDFEDLLSVRK